MGASPLQRLSIKRALEQLGPTEVARVCREACQALAEEHEGGAARSWREAAEAFVMAAGGTPAPGAEVAAIAADCIGVLARRDGVALPEGAARERGNNLAQALLAHYAVLKRPHTQDEDCTVGEAGSCLECGVLHGAACPSCGGQGFHRPRCSHLLPQEQEQGAPISLPLRGRR